MAAGFFSKILVDIIKPLPIKTPPWSYPLMALGLALFASFLLAMKGVEPLFTRQGIAGVILTGIGGTVAAMAATMGQTKADKVDERIDKALEMEPGSTPKDVDKAMEKEAAKA